MTAAEAPSLPELAGCEALQRLFLNGCEALKSLPSLDGLTVLQRLNLSGCKGLTSRPDLDALRQRGVTEGRINEGYQ